MNRFPLILVSNLISTLPLTVKLPLTIWLPLNVFEPVVADVANKNLTDSLTLWENAVNWAPSVDCDANTPNTTSTGVPLPPLKPFPNIEVETSNAVNECVTIKSLPNERDTILEPLNVLVAIVSIVFLNSVPYKALPLLANTWLSVPVAAIVLASTYVLTACCDGTVSLPGKPCEFNKVSLSDASLITIPTGTPFLLNGPIEDKPDNENWFASIVTAPVNWSTLKNLPTFKLPLLSIVTANTFPGSIITTSCVESGIPPYSGIAL